jgi:hypothetical protein
MNWMSRSEQTVCDRVDTMLASHELDRRGHTTPQGGAAVFDGQQYQRLPINPVTSVQQCHRYPRPAVCLTALSALLSQSSDKLDRLIEGLEVKKLSCATSRSSSFDKYFPWPVMKVNNTLQTILKSDFIFLY